MSDQSDEKARARQRTVNAYHRVFKSVDGITIMADMEEVFGLNAPAFLSTSGYNATHAAIRDGQRQVHLHILAMLRRTFEGDGNLKTPTNEVRKE